VYGLDGCVLTIGAPPPLVAVDLRLQRREPTHHQHGGWLENTRRHGCGSCSARAVHTAACRRLPVGSGSTFCRSSGDGRTNGEGTSCCTHRTALLPPGRAPAGLFATAFESAILSGACVSCAGRGGWSGFFARQDYVAAGSTPVELAPRVAARSN